MTIVSTAAIAGKYTNAVAGVGGLQGRVLWCDADANARALNTKEQVAALADRCKEANINVIVVDVKPLSGVVLYNSKIAPKLKESKGVQYPQYFDLLRAMVEEGHRVGIEVHAAINVFAEGRIGMEEGGSALSHPEWQCIEYDVERWVSAAGADGYPISCTDRLPLPGRLALISKEKAMPTNIQADVFIVQADENGTVTEAAFGEPVTPFPANGFAVLGSGVAGEWLTANSETGKCISIEGRPKFVLSGKAADQHKAIFVNPANLEAKSYELAVVAEIATNYAVDGIVFDRMRYPGMYADFSELSRAEFEEWLGKRVENFPEDIFAIDPIPGREMVRGKHFGKWMEWRAKQIRDFVVEAKEVIKSIRPDALVGAYVGSWYGSYYDVGVNWASPDHKPPYDFASPTYKETGYADLVDWMTTGCYYQYPTRAEARAAGANESGSVEAAGKESNDVVEDDTFVYAGLYLLQYAKDPEAFIRAIETANSTTQGVMLFDLVYVRDYNWWDLLKRAFPAPVRPPHALPGLKEKIKELKTLIEHQ